MLSDQLLTNLKLICKIHTFTGLKFHLLYQVKIKKSLKYFVFPWPSYVSNNYGKPVYMGFQCVCLYLLNPNFAQFNTCHSVFCHTRIQIETFHITVKRGPRNVHSKNLPHHLKLQWFMISLYTIHSLYAQVHNTVQKSKAYTRASPLNTKTK